MCMKVKRIACLDINQDTMKLMIFYFNFVVYFFNVFRLFLLKNEFIFPCENCFIGIVVISDEVPFSFPPRLH